MTEQPEESRPEFFDEFLHDFREQVLTMAINADKAALFAAMPIQRQIECVTAGLLSGLMMYCFGSVNEEAHDDVMGMIQYYLPLARQYAEIAIAQMEAEYDAQR